MKTGPPRATQKEGRPRQVVGPLFFRAMYYFYVLYSLKDQKLYKGVSADVAARVARHNAGATPATEHRRPFVLIYKESFSSKTEALARERWAKTP